MYTCARWMTQHLDIYFVPMLTLESLTLIVTHFCGTWRKKYFFRQLPHTANKTPVLHRTALSTLSTLSTVTRFISEEQWHDCVRVYQYLCSDNINCNTDTLCCAAQQWVTGTWIGHIIKISTTIIKCYFLRRYIYSNILTELSWRVTCWMLPCIDSDSDSRGQGHYS